MKNHGFLKGVNLAKL